MPELQGPKGELRITLDIVRVATGETETVELIGFVDPEELKAALAANQQEQVHG